jgi:hypothetical protein
MNDAFSSWSNHPSANLVRMPKDRVQFEKTAEAIHDWLDAHELDGTDEFDLEEQGDVLADLNRLTWAGAPECEITLAVSRARRTGCSWAPIAMALGIPRQRVRTRYRD